jgi:hypothetical protein
LAVQTTAERKDFAPMKIRPTAMQGESANNNEDRLTTKTGKTINKTKHNRERPDPNQTY